jgi:hypothetical protein
MLILSSQFNQARKLDTCDTLKGCYFVNIKTREERLLSGSLINVLELDSDNEWGYSVRCDVTRENGDSNYISFFYDNKNFTEWGYPRYINGNAYEGAWINPTSYLSVCGTKQVAIEGHIWSKMCFSKTFNMEIWNANKEPCVLSAPSNAPTKLTTQKLTKVPTIALIPAPKTSPVITPSGPLQSPVKAPIRAPKTSPVITPVKAPSAPLQAPIKAPKRPPVKSPTVPVVKPINTPTNKPAIAPVSVPSMDPSKSPTVSPVTSTVAPVLPLTRNPTKAPVHTLTKVPTNYPVEVPIIPSDVASFSPSKAPIQQIPTKFPISNPLTPPIKTATAAPTVTKCQMGYVLENAKCKRSLVRYFLLRMKFW